MTRVINTHRRTAAALSPPTCGKIMPYRHGLTLFFCFTETSGHEEKSNGSQRRYLLQKQPSPFLTEATAVISAKWSHLRANPAQ